MSNNKEYKAKANENKERDAYQRRQTLLKDSGWRGVLFRIYLNILIMIFTLLASTVGVLFISGIAWSFKNDIQEFLRMLSDFRKTNSEKIIEACHQQFLEDFGDRYPYTSLEGWKVARKDDSKFNVKNNYYVWAEGTFLNKKAGFSCGGTSENPVIEVHPLDKN